MAETVLVRTEAGAAMVHDLPLPAGLAERVAKGEAQVLGPCDADGNLTAPEVTPEPEPTPEPEVKAEPGPVKRATKKTAAPSVPEE